MVDLTDKYVGKECVLDGEVVNPNYAFLINEINNYDYLVMQGGTRSGKTYSTMMYFWDCIEAYKGLDITVCRQSMPTIKGTVLKDFIEIGNKRGIYSVSNHNQTESVYRKDMNSLSFIGADDEEKARGRGQTILYANEAPELSWEVFDQLDMRTTGKTIIDYNPSYPDSWVYENILTRDDCALIRTTYKDNPFVSPKQIAKLEWMRINDPDRYRIYGLGERGEVKGQIYSNWRAIKEDAFPRDANAFVIDFGFSQDPAVIAKFKHEGHTIWAKQLVYEIGLDNVDLMIHLFFNGANDSSMIIADGAEPKSISELRNGRKFEEEYITEKAAKLGYEFRGRDHVAKLMERLGRGFYVNPAIKGNDSIKNGIQKVCQHEILITEDSNDAWKEYTLYKYKEDRHTGRTTRIPIDAHNHFCDSLRYYVSSIGRLFKK